MTDSLTRALDMVHHANYITLEKPTKVSSMTEKELYDWTVKLSSAKMAILQIEHMIDNQLMKVRT